jgi:hypothetical protein
VCDIEPTLCKLVLDLLVNEKFLSLKSDGRYTRISDGAERPPLQAAKAFLRTDQRDKKGS